PCSFGPFVPLYSRAGGHRGDSIARGGRTSLVRAGCAALNYPSSPARWPALAKVGSGDGPGSSESSRHSVQGRLAKLLQADSPNVSERPFRSFLNAHSDDRLWHFRDIGRRAAPNR